MEGSDKRRFELRKDEDGSIYIRAVQGHSLKVVDDEKPLRRLHLGDDGLPNGCVHGAYRKRPREGSLLEDVMARIPGTMCTSHLVNLFFLYHQVSRY